MRYPESVLRRFRQRMDELAAQYGPDECWPWSETAERHDWYGEIGGSWSDGRRYKFFTHRLAHDLLVKAIPDGAEVLHSCDYKPCANPGHLRADSHAANLDEARERMRFARGVKQGHARLNDEAVRDIRRRAAAGEMLKTLGAEYGVSPATIGDAVHRKTWRHVA